MLGTQKDCIEDLGDLKTKRINEKIILVEKCSDLQL
jgi:hypothetical protein